VKDDLSRLGYAVVPSILDAAEIAQLRKICCSQLTANGSQEMPASEFVSIPELAAVPVKDGVVAALKSVLGEDYRVYPNFIVRKDVYVPWHVDDAFTGPGGEYVWRPEFAHVQAAVYLQDNDERTGGGIDVIPGSHLMSFDTFGQTKPDFDTGAAVLEAAGRRTMVRAKAGDLVLWHARLLHISTPVIEASTEDKLGLFFSCGRHDPYENSRFVTHLLGKRIRLNGDRGVVNPRFAEIAEMRYPDSYPEWLVDRMRAQGTAIATL
jgi:hypothetical protein